MAKDTRVTFESENTVSSKPIRKSRPQRQFSYEDAENRVNELSESYPALSSKAHRLMRQVSTSFNSRTIKVALILSVILNLLLGIPFGIFFGFWMSQKNEMASFVAAHSQSPSSSSSSSSSSLLSQSGDSLAQQGFGRNYIVIESCFPCGAADIEHVNSKVKIRSKNNFCCSDDKSGYDGSGHYFYSAEYYNTKVNGRPDTDLAQNLPPCRSQVDGGPKASAHMVLDVTQTKLNVKGHGNSPKIPLAWIADDVNQVGSSINNVGYADGQLTIIHPGTYYVYTHVTLSTNDNKLPEDVPEKIIVLSLQIQTLPNPPSTVLFSQITMKPNEVRGPNIMGTFKLKKGDIVSVYVSYPSFLKNSLPANVFGLYLV